MPRECRYKAVPPIFDIWSYLTPEEFREHFEPCVRMPDARSLFQELETAYVRHPEDPLYLRHGIVDLDTPGVSGIIGTQSEV